MQVVWYWQYRKCQFTSYGINNNDPLIYNGAVIKSETKDVHLLYIIGPSANCDIMLYACYYSFTLCANSLRHKFQRLFIWCKSTPIPIMFQVFIQKSIVEYCRNKISRFYSAPPKAIRKEFHLSNKTYYELFPLTADCMPIERQFIVVCLSSKNLTLCWLTDLVTKISGSSISTSVNV